MRQPARSNVLSLSGRPAPPLAPERIRILFGMPSGARADELIGLLADEEIETSVYETAADLFTAIDEQSAALIVIGPEFCAKLGVRLLERASLRARRSSAPLIAFVDSSNAAMLRDAADLEIAAEAWTNANDAAGHIRGMLSRWMSDARIPKAGKNPPPQATVLAVDDSATYRYLLEKLLAADGYRTLIAPSGEDAIRILETEHIDCILLDRKMVGMGGLETCRLIRAEPRWANIPVVFLTASDKRSATIAGFDAGADDYVPKSSDAAILRSRIRAHVRRKLADDQNRFMREELYQKQLEAMREHAANRAKSAFLAVMSHEIRTPMNAVIGMTELALRGPMSDEQRSWLKTALSSAESLLVLINDILDFSKIEEGKLSLDRLPFNLRETIGDVLKTLSLQARLKHLALDHHVDETVANDLIGDPGRLRQVMLNLVGNALKFTNQGEVSVSVTVDRQTEDDVSLLFAVRDTGVGVPRELHEKIFRPFEQADASVTRKHGGTGLGLAVSAKLVGMMGGKIWVESALNQGSTFWFTAVFGRNQQRTELMPPIEKFSIPEVGDSLVPRRSLRVLLVEDNAVNRQFATLLLDRFGHQVVAAETGLRGVELARSEAFDVILMDIQMPEMDGLEATAAIRSLETDGHVPIIAMTAEALRGDRERCLAAGCDDYLSKPFRAHDLAKVLERWTGLPSTEAGAVSGMHAAASHAGVATFSEEEALERASGDRELLAEVIKVLLADAPAQLLRLQSAIDRNDRVDLRRAAHALKGAVGNVGARPIVELLREVERASVDAEPASLSTMIESIRTDWLALHKELSAWLEST